MVLPLVEVEGVVVGGAVAAAEFIFSRGNEGKCVVGTATHGGEVVVECHVLGYGLPGELAAFEHQMEVNHYFALAYAFS